MKRWVFRTAVVILVLVQCLGAALSEGRPSGEFLDPAALTYKLGVLFSDNYEYMDVEAGRADAYAAYVYEQPQDLEAFIREYRARMASDYDYETYLGQIDAQPCIWFTRGDGRAFLFYDYQGRMLLLTPVRYGFVPLSSVEAPEPTPGPTPEPTPGPTPEPTPEPATGSVETQGISQAEGEWRWVDVEVDCPSCINGICPTCEGMGYTTMYGIRVECDPKCSACGGNGTFSQRQYHFFPAGSDTWLY